MKTLAESDGDVYLPNPEPSERVDYILICMAPSLGHWARSAEEAAERQRKIDKENLEFARQESVLAKQALADRTEKREAERERTEGQLSEAANRFGTELQAIRDRANNTVARLADSFSSPVTLDPTPPSITDNSGNVTQAFDFSSLSTSTSTSPGVDTSVIDRIGTVAGVVSPFAATQFSFVTWILKENLTTMDQLSTVIANFDRATPADIERIWHDYGQRVWSPEQWISKIVIDTTVGAVGHYALKAIVPEPEVLARDLVDSLAGRRTASGPIVFKVADEPGWWTGRTVTRQADNLRRDADGMPLLKDFTGNIYGYNPATNRVSYSRREMEQLVAHGDFSTFTENVSELKWTNNHAIVLPAGPMGPGGLYLEPKLHSSETRVFFPGQPQDQPLLEQALKQFVYSPVEAGIGEALTRMLNGSDPENPRTEQQLSAWLKALAADIDAKKRGVRQ